MISPSLQARTHTIAIFFDFFSIFSCISYNVLFFFVLFKCSFFRLKLIDFPVLPLYQINSLFYIFFRYIELPDISFHLLKKRFVFFLLLLFIFLVQQKMHSLFAKKKKIAQNCGNIFIFVFFF